MYNVRFEFGFQGNVLKLQNHKVYTIYTTCYTIFLRYLKGAYREGGEVKWKVIFLKVTRYFVKNGCCCCGWDDDSIWLKRENPKYYLTLITGLLLFRVPALVLFRHPTRFLTIAKIYTKRQKKKKTRRINLIVRI